MTNGSYKKTDIVFSEPALPVLSARLMAIAQMVQIGTHRVIDVGTDHAYLPIWLVANNISEQAIASDLRSGPAERAAANIHKYGLDQSIIVKTGDGITGIDLDQSDTVIIAGMGGLEIQKILNSDLPDGMNLLLQPQRSLEELRFWLCTDRKWQIIDEEIVHDRGHFYVIMNVRTRHTTASSNGEICCPALNLIECWLGPILIRKYANVELCDASARDLWISYLEDREKTLNKAVRGNADLSQVLTQIETILHDAREFRKRGDA